jgi:hypothetical protein
LFSLAVPIAMGVGGWMGEKMKRHSEVVAAARARAHSKAPWRPPVATAA